MIELCWQTLLAFSRIFISISILFKIVLFFSRCHFCIFLSMDHISFITFWLACCWTIFMWLAKIYKVRQLKYRFAMPSMLCPLWLVIRFIFTMRSFLFSSYFSLVIDVAHWSCFLLCQPYESPDISRFCLFVWYCMFSHIFWGEYFSDYELWNYNVLLLFSEKNNTKKYSVEQMLQSFEDY